MKVYIAGPYTEGEWGVNIRRVVEAAEEIWQSGHTPFIPHTTTALWSIISDREGHEWLEFDFEWLDSCDALVRVDGHSPGAEKEIEYAEKNNIPVYYGVDKFLEEVPHDSEN